MLSARDSIRKRQASMAVNLDSPAHPAADGLRLRLSAYLFDEVGDYEQWPTCWPPFSMA